MEPNFFAHFFPRIISVQKREPSYWIDKGHSVLVRSASILNFFYVFEGAGSLELDDIRCPLSADSMFHISLKSRFKLMSLPDRPLLYFSVHYDYKWIEWEEDTDKGMIPPKSSLPFAPVLQLQNHEMIHSGMQLLHDIWHKKDTGYEWKARLAFLNILNEVNEQQRSEQEELPNTQSILRCMDYIRKHYDEPMKREELAEKASLSINHFSALFKQYSGYSPMQYITKVRLDKAKQMLRNSNLPISEVARKVGFQDPLYFARVFTKETGFSPRAYRKA